MNSVCGCWKLNWNSRKDCYISQITDTRKTEQNKTNKKMHISCCLFVSLNVMPKKGKREPGLGLLLESHHAATCHLIFIDLAGWGIAVAGELQFLVLNEKTHWQNITSAISGWFSRAQLSSEEQDTAFSSCQVCLYTFSGSSSHRHPWMLSPSS